jgi:hypothetical protein
MAAVMFILINARLCDFSSVSDIIVKDTTKTRGKCGVILHSRIIISHHQHLWISVSHECFRASDIVSFVGMYVISPLNANGILVWVAKAFLI